MATTTGQTDKPKPHVKPGDAKEPRGKRYKKAPKPLSNEQLALLDEFTKLGVRAQKLKVLSAQQVGALIDREPKTLEEDRAKQRKALAKGDPIDLTSPISIPYAAPATGEKEVKYILHDVLEYLDRVYSRIDRSFLKTARAGIAMRGIQSWLAYGSAADLWTFCIQPDGRPLSMADAIATDRLTDDTQRLTIGEYSEKLAKAVNAKHARDENTRIAKSSRKPREVKVDRKDRWVRPGGPI